MADECFLVLGGAGLVGLQTVCRIAHDLEPRRIVVASLYRKEVNDALKELRRMFGDRRIEFVGEWGDVFVREEFTKVSRPRLLESYIRRDALYDDLMGDIDTAYEQSRLVQIIREHSPNVIVDSINTATAISYQDVYTATVVAKNQIDALLEKVVAHHIDDAKKLWKDTERAFETLALSQSIPQLIRHVLLLYRAMREVGTRLYLKIGTTGTGGMGLNIPYTHGEDKPSAKLMSKTAVAFAHTGLLFLMARTPGGPIVKEIKPGAMIGYAKITCRTISQHGSKAYLHASQVEPLGELLALKLPEGRFERLQELDLPVVDTGENGLFTKGEFEAITSLRQMEFVTPEEIALEVVLEIRGSNTGRDVIAAIDSSVMPPTYRAGYLRQQALAELERLERETNTHSVALGRLGPPELSKLLWEAELLKIEFGKISEVLARSPGELTQAVYRRIQDDANLRHTITSVGIPILTPSGNQLIRGPSIRIPEAAGECEVPIGDDDIDNWAAKGWVDLRPTSFSHWQERFTRMERARLRLRGHGSAAVTREAYLSDEIRIGSVVGWIFNNEIGGYRVK